MRTRLDIIHPSSQPSNNKHNSLISSTHRRSLSENKTKQKKANFFYLLFILEGREGRGMMMAAFLPPLANVNCSLKPAISSAFPFLQPPLALRVRGGGPSSYAGLLLLQSPMKRRFAANKLSNTTIPSATSSSNSTDDPSSSHHSKKTTPFGYTRKDVILIGLGVTFLGVGLKTGLEFSGVDPLQAGNVVQLVLVLGLTLGWISTYIFRVSNKEMTYAQQLRDYESKVMEKRLESLTEAELQALLEEVEEEKSR